MIAEEWVVVCERRYVNHQHKITTPGQPLKKLSPHYLVLYNLEYGVNIIKVSVAVLEVGLCIIFIGLVKVGEGAWWKVQGWILTNICYLLIMWCDTKLKSGVVDFATWTDPVVSIV